MPASFGVERQALVLWRRWLFENFQAHGHGVGAFAQLPRLLACALDQVPQVAGLVRRAGQFRAQHCCHFVVFRHFPLDGGHLVPQAGKRPQRAAVVGRLWHWRLDAELADRQYQHQQRDGAECAGDHVQKADRGVVVAATDPLHGYGQTNVAIANRGAPLRWVRFMDTASPWPE